jgi:hypothetical protein
MISRESRVIFTSKYGHLLRKKKSQPKYSSVWADVCYIAFLDKFSLFSRPFLSTFTMDPDMNMSTVSAKCKMCQIH